MMEARYARRESAGDRDGMARLARPGLVRQHFPAAAAGARLPLPVTVYLLCIALPVWFNIGPLSMSLLRLFLLVMIVPLTVRLLMGRYGPVLFTDAMFLLHVTWMAVALAVNNPAQAIQQTGSVGIEFIGGYVLARACIRSREQFVGLCRALGIFVICTLPFAMYEAWTGRQLIFEAIRAIPGLDSFARIRPDPRLGLQRVQVIFAHAIQYGLFCSVTFSLTFVALKGTIGTPRRYLFSGLVTFGCFLSLSSGALLAILLQFGLIIWNWALGSLRHRWLLLLALLGAGYIVIDLLSNRTPLAVFMSYATFSAQNAFYRAAIFEWGMVNVWSSPVFGLGLNDWIRPAWMELGSVDNFWLVMAMRYGIPGLLFLAVGYGAAIFRIMLRDFADDPALGQVRLAWVLTFLGLTFTLSTVHIWSNSYSFTFFMFGAGMWLIDVGRTPHSPPDAGRHPARGDGNDLPSGPDPDTRPRPPAYTRFAAARTRGTAGAGREAARPPPRGPG